MDPEDILDREDIVRVLESPTRVENWTTRKKAREYLYSSNRKARVIRIARSKEATGANIHKGHSGGNLFTRRTF